MNANHTLGLSSNTRLIPVSGLLRGGGDLAPKDMRWFKGEDNLIYPIGMCSVQVYHIYEYTLYTQFAKKDTFPFDIQSYTYGSKHLS